MSTVTVRPGGVRQSPADPVPDRDPNVSRSIMNDLATNTPAPTTASSELVDLVVKGMDGAIAAKRVTYDFARLMEGAKEVKCSEFGDALIRNM